MSWLSACGGSAGSTSAPSPAPTAPGLVTIAEVQGSGMISALEGDIVTVAGVVTGDFQDGDADPRSLRGFFMQSTAPDGDPATSEGVFVFEAGGMIVDVAVGDQVEVVGEVKEFFGETQIEAARVRITGTGEIAATPVTLPLPTTTNSDGELIANLEALEGMLIRVEQDLLVSDLFALEEYGELSLHAGGRPYQFTNQSAPDVADYRASVEARAAATLLLDDGDSRRNISPIYYLNPDPRAEPSRTIRLGDTLAGLEGNVRYSRGSGGGGTETYRIVAMERPTFTATNPRPTTPPDVGGSLRVAGMNLLNYFEGIDNGNATCGPQSSAGCRGADSADEFQRQQQKQLVAIASIDADIVGLVEVENNDDGALQALVNALNKAAGNAKWAYVATGNIGGDAIRVGLIYQSASVELVGDFQLLDSSVDARFTDTKNRPVLLQAFRQRDNGAVLSVAVAHLKSKGSPCTDVGDPNRGDGQGNCNATRTNAAAAIADWLLSDPAGLGDADSVLIGDLNAYLQEDPLAAMEDAGLISLLKSAVAADAYSFAFRGAIGALDHAVASPSLAEQVSGVAEWHINADEPRVLDYNLDNGRNPALFDPTSPSRFSDHDPVIIGFELAGN